MGRFASIIFGLITSLVLILPNSLLAYTSLGSPNGFVNDFTSTLTTEQISSLESKLTQFEKATKNEIGVVIIKSLDGDSIENFAEKLFQEWGIGKAETDNGVLLLVSLDDRRMRIEVGYGLEGDLTDLLSSRIIRETLTPAFREGDFYGGIDKATNDMISIVSGKTPENFLTTTDNYENNIESSIDWFFWIMLFVSTVPMTLASILGVSKSWWAGGVLGGVVGVIFGFIWGFIYVGIGSVVILTLIGLLFDFLVSRSYAKSKLENGKPPWWMSGGRGIGGGGFRGGGGSSFGGFSGGSSGGGGSSGSW